MSEVYRDLSILSIKRSYDSDQDDIINDFYIPILENTKIYYRSVAYFSSSSLIAAARGIAGLIKYSGQMKLLVGKLVSKSDFYVLSNQELMDRIGDEIEKQLSDEFIKLTNLLERRHIESLAWMVKNGHLEIRFAIMEKPAPGSPQNPLGIFHDKLGIFQDIFGNMLSFSGSINETRSAWISNIEEFKTFKSWDVSQNEYVMDDFKRWKKYWNNKSKKFRVISTPKQVKTYMERIVPHDFNISNIHEIEKLYENGIQIIDNLQKNQFNNIIQPYDYQKQAIESWLENDFSGIYSMATGTGKTYTSLLAIQKIDNWDNFVVIIIVPFSHLITQWQKAINQFSFENIITTTHSSWNTLYNYCQEIRLGFKKNGIIITTHSKFRGRKFQQIMDDFHHKGTQLCLIADEVHSMGSTENRKALKDVYTYRLGLTATPNRWFDDEGTRFLLEFFNGIVYEYSLKKAIPEFLTPYDYYPYFINLTFGEQKKYDKLTQNINSIDSETEDKEKKNILESLLRKRSRIVVNAIGKEAFLYKLVISKQSEIEHCLLYVSPQQKPKIIEVLNRNSSIIYSQITQEESLQERNRILEDFGKANTKLLMAIKCLDEGVDIPQTKEAIFLASSTNPKEFIQRRGRVLRKFPGKSKAIIHDLIVVQYNGEVISREMDRIMEFIDASQNSENCVKNIKQEIDNSLIPVRYMEQMNNYLR